MLIHDMYSSENHFHKSSVLEYDNFNYGGKSTNFPYHRFDT